MSRYHGRAGKLYLEGSGGLAIPMVALSEWSIDESKARVDATSFDDSNIVEYAGLPMLSGKFNGYWDDTYDSLFLATEANVSKKMYIYPSTGVATRYWQGLAWVDYSITGSVKDMVKIAGSFSAGGSWTRA
jgi:hypothetical protein